MSVCCEEPPAAPATRMARGLRWVAMRWVARVAGLVPMRSTPVRSQTPLMTRRMGRVAWV